MALNNVNFPYAYAPNFDSGRPVYNGYIYIGEPDLDPEVLANQKAIYFVQEDGNQVVGIQPVRTGAGGVPTYNGSPVAIKIDGDYSVKVLNSSQSQVYYSPNGNVSESILNALQTVATLAELQASVALVGSAVYVKGRATAGDGYEGNFRITSENLSAKVAVDTVSGIYVALASGLYAVRQFGAAAETGAVINAAWFGRKGDGVTNDTNAMQVCDSVASLIKCSVQCFGGVSPHNYLNLTANWDFSKATLKPLSNSGAPVDQVIKINNYVTIENADIDITAYVSATASTDDVITATGTTGAVIRNISFLGNSVQNDFSRLILADNSIRIRIEHNKCFRFYGECVRAASSRNSKFNYNHFEDIERSTIPGFLNRAILIGGSTNYQAIGNTAKNLGTLSAGSANSVAFFDVGGATNGVIVGNVGENIHSFIDIETGVAGTKHKISVTGNSATGLGSTLRRTGTHNGSNNVTVLTDTTKSYTVDSLIGYRLWNQTDGSTATVVSNTATTVTFDALIGGIDNDFDTGDAYILYPQGKGLWINAPNNVRAVTFGANDMSGFSSGITCTSASAVTVTGGTVSDCFTGCAMSATREFTVVGLVATDCYRSFYVEQVSGFSGGTITGCVSDGTTAHYLETKMSGSSALGKDKLTLSSNHWNSGTLRTEDAFDDRLIKDVNNSTGAVTITAGTALNLFGERQWNVLYSAATTLASVAMAYGETKILVVQNANMSIAFNNAAGGIYGNNNVNATVAVTANSILEVTRIYDNDSVFIKINR